MRRLQALALGLALAASCKSSGGGGDDGGPGQLDDTAAVAARAACTFKRGALAKDTLGASAKLGKDIPLDTIVVIIQENRSFDSYYSHLGKFAQRTDIDGAQDSTTNPETVGSSPGTTHPYLHAQRLCFLDTNHEWPGSHVEYDDGNNDGFFQENNGWTPVPDGGDPALGSGDRALWWYDEREIPFYYQLASTFGIGDRYFCSILGPTWPNRMYAYAATSFGRTTNEFPNIDAFPYPQNDAVIFDSLEKAKVSWNIVSESVPGPAVVVSLSIVNRWGRNPLIKYDEFFQRAAAGTLPQVTYFEAHIGSEAPGQNDEHPPADVQVGQKLISDVVHAMFKSPQWGRSAIFITYDEHGGLYDHVPPPKACAPDAIAPILAADDHTVGGFDRYGFRVPLIVVSPFSKRSYVSHEISDHTSVLRFLETRFDLGALTARDANANALLDYFDFDHPHFVSPPDIPEPAIDQAELDWCEITLRKQ
jgi:phospholipase C